MPSFLEDTQAQGSTGARPKGKHISMTAQPGSYLHQHAGKPSGEPPEEEAVMVELELDGHVHTKQACRVRWGIALREMLRKRALVAGEASSLLLSCAPEDVTTPGATAL